MNKCSVFVLGLLLSEMCIVFNLVMGTIKISISPKKKNQNKNKTKEKREICSTFYIADHDANTTPIRLEQGGIQGLAIYKRTSLGGGPKG